MPVWNPKLRPQTLKSVKINSYKNRKMTIHQPVELCCGLFRMQISQKFSGLCPWTSLGRACSAHSENYWIPPKLYSAENSVSSAEYNLIVPTEFNKLYSSSLSYLIYLVLWNWPVCNPFLDLFANLFPLAFFLIVVISLLHIM